MLDDTMSAPPEKLPVSQELSSSGLAELLPARMVNEFVYCPRLFWLEYVEREFASSYDTVDGERVHRRVDRPTGELPEDVVEMRKAATSVDLASERLGVVAKIDIVQPEGDGVVPVDFKRGKEPPVPGGVNDPERVQLGVAALLLREHGYRCDVGRIYYAASRTYVDVQVDDGLVSQTTAAVAGARAIREQGTIPPPLVDSPKCGRCSLHAICLPDETNTLRKNDEPATIRPFAAPSDRRLATVERPGDGGGLQRRSTPPLLEFPAFWHPSGPLPLIGRRWCSKVRAKRPVAQSFLRCANSATRLSRPH
jgi:CRISP-associated protein Cas1